MSLETSGRRASAMATTSPGAASNCHRIRHALYRVIGAVLLAMPGFWSFQSTALARLGDTREECIERYGKPVEVNGDGGILEFEHNGMSIACLFCMEAGKDRDALCDSVTYSSPERIGEVAPEHVSAALSDHLQGSEWGPPQILGKGGIGEETIWKRADGVEARLSGSLLLISLPKPMIGTGGKRFGPLRAKGNPPVASVIHRTVQHSMKDMKQTRNVRHISEFGGESVSYIAPDHDGEEGILIYRFDVVGHIDRASLSCSTFCVDFPKARGRPGRGSAAVELSVDGTTWVPLMDQIGDYAWGENWSFEGDLPDVVRGASSVWLRVTLLSQGCESESYGCAQFGRTPPDGRSPVLMFTAHLKPEGASP